jgi:hypothetical protein
LLIEAVGNAHVVIAIFIAHHPLSRFAPLHVRSRGITRGSEIPPRWVVCGDSRRKTESTDGRVSSGVLSVLK